MMIRHGVEDIFPEFLPCPARKLCQNSKIAASSIILPSICCAGGGGGWGGGGVWC